MSSSKNVYNNSKTFDFSKDSTSLYEQSFNYVSKWNNIGHDLFSNSSFKQRKSPEFIQTFQPTVKVIPKKRQKKNSRFKTRLSSNSKKLLTSSSLPAISQIGHADTNIRKVIWTLILIAVVVGFAFHVRYFTTFYMEYPVMENLEVETMQKLGFPAVTVCNMNRMYSKYETCLYGNLSFQRKCFGEESSRYRGPGRKTKNPDGTVLVISERRKHFSGLSGNNLTQEQMFLRAYYLASEELRRNISVEPRKFISSCSFRGRRCSWKDFKATLNYNFGFCLTFTNNKSISLDTSSVGKEEGLQLTLNFFVDSYLPHTSTTGGKITIHRPGEIPELEEGGISVSPGTETSIAIRQAVIERLPSPYQDRCENYPSDVINRGNSQKECTKYCIQEYSVSRCGCSDPTLPRSSGWPLCDLDDREKMQCLDEALVGLAKESYLCRCPLPCSETIYKGTVSHAAFPAQGFHSKITQFDIKTYKKNNGKVNVFYGSFERKTFLQRPVYHGSELFSNLGGELGLWLGICLFAFFELLETAIEFCKFVFHSMKNRIKKTRVSVISLNRQ